MSSPSVPDSVTCATPKAQSLSQQRSITDDKSSSDLNPSNQGGSSKKRKRQKEKKVKESKAKEPFPSSSIEEEKEKGDIGPPSTMKKKKKKNKKVLNLSHDDPILGREDKQAVSTKPLGSEKLCRPGMNAQLKAKKQGRKKPQVKVPFTCEFCNVKGKSTAAYIMHMGGLAHINRVLLLSKRVASLRQAASGGINDQNQRADVNGALFAELLATVLSKTQATIRESVAGALPADIPLHTSVPGPSSKPHLLQTQASEIQAHVESEDPSGQTKSELAVDAEVLAAPTSMDGPSYEAQFFQTQVSEIKARVEMEKTSRETKTGRVVAAEILAPSFMAGPSCESQLLPRQGSEIKTHVEMENPSGETKALAIAAVIPAPTSMSGPSFEPQLLQTQVSKFKAHVGMGNPSGEIETDLGVTAEVPEPTSEAKQKLLPVPLRSKAKAGSSVSTKSGEGSETKQQL